MQVGINLEKMMENQKATALENMEVFGVEKVENFTSMRTREGDLLIMKAHELARKEIKALYPDIKVGLTLSLHDIQPQAGRAQPLNGMKNFYTISLILRRMIS